MLPCVVLAESSAQGTGPPTQKNNFLIIRQIRKYIAVTFSNLHSIINLSVVIVCAPSVCVNLTNSSYIA